MIISNKHKYIFIELPRTGTTAIASELLENYDGEEIFKKHTTYRHFLKNCSKEKNNYYAFSCRRNPIDRIFSYYEKMKNGYYDYKWTKDSISTYEKYSLLPTVKWIQQNDISFDEYLNKKFKLPYCDWSILDHARLNYVIDFEDLNNGFKSVLNELEIDIIRDLPEKNVTKEKRKIEDVLNKVSTKELARVFGPYLIENRLYYENYNMDDIKSNVTSIDRMKYQISKMKYKIYYGLNPK